MKTNQSNIISKSNELKELLGAERAVTVKFLKVLEPFMQRRMHEALGYPSAYKFLTVELKLSEASAMRRINCSKLATRFPIVYEYIEKGLLNLTTAPLLLPHITEKNSDELFRLCAGKSRSEIEFILVQKFNSVEFKRDVVRFFTVPKPAVSPLQPTVYQKSVSEIKQLNQGAATSSIPNNSLNDASSQMADMKVRYSFTADKNLDDMVVRAKEVLRPKYQRPTLEEVFGESLSTFLQKKDPQYLKIRSPIVAPSQPNKAESRYIPAHIRALVYKRDNYCCTFKGIEGKRCEERAGIEIDHIQPFAMGGSSTNPNNLRLLCKAHNMHMARRTFGEEKIDCFTKN